MENKFNNRDFEQFVKQNADQYRMFPSEKVWNGIHRSLHTRRRWYGIATALLFITVTAVTFVMVNNPGKDQESAFNTGTNLISNLQKENSPVYIAPAKTLEIKTGAPANTPKKLPALLLADAGIQPSPDFPVAAPAIAEENTSLMVIVNPIEREINFTTTSKKELVATHKPAITTFNSPVSHQKGLFTSITDDTYADQEVISSNKSIALITDINLMTIESVINSYKYKRKAKHVAVQLSFAPGISYRTLKENKAFIRAAQNNNAIPLANVYVPDVNNIVTHKPDVGFQLGLTAGYPLSKKFTLTAGLQFAVSKYDIKAYSHPSEVTTIALSNAAGGTNTVSAYTNYRNTGGYNTNWLRNLYVSAGAPVGLEWKVARNKKGFVGIGGNVQPTFVLDNQSYLLSTDFKNYAEIPSLIRKWNINTAFEIFAANTTGKVQWRIGPQVRYQTMSSFKKTYPVKEYLFDFGLKMGIMLK